MSIPAYAKPVLLVLLDGLLEKSQYTSSKRGVQLASRSTKESARTAGVSITQWFGCQKRQIRYEFSINHVDNCARPFGGATNLMVQEV